jgi:hypothetical protein
MHTSIEKIEIEFSDMKIIDIEITFVYRNITSCEELMTVQ